MFEWVRRDVVEYDFTITINYEQFMIVREWVNRRLKEPVHLMIGDSLKLTLCVRSEDEKHDIVMNLIEPLIGARQCS